MSVIEEIAEPHRTVLATVLQEKAPSLLAELRTAAVPTLRQSEAVADVMIDAMSEHFLPGHEPDETGKAIDNALGGFYLRWPDNGLVDPPAH